ncbi:MAG: hypothetical protein RMM28_01180 [Thermoleophilia bacterium]|nr:hypothetical protein [Thermoleophilia bacterium]
MRSAALLLGALAAVAAVVLPYAALGGGSYAPAPVADPCTTSGWQRPEGVQELLERLALTGFARAACELGVTREELVLALRSEEALDRFARAHGRSLEEVEATIREGLRSTADDAEAAGDLPGIVSPLVRRAIDELSPTVILDTLERLSALLP